MGVAGCRLRFAVCGLWFVVCGLRVEGTYQSLVWGEEDGDTGVDFADRKRDQHVGGFGGAPAIQLIMIFQLTGERVVVDLGQVGVVVVLGSWYLEGGTWKVVELARGR